MELLRTEIEGKCCYLGLLNSPKSKQLTLTSDIYKDKICYEVFADILYQGVLSGGTIFAVRVGHNFQHIMSGRTECAGTECPRRHFVQGDTLYCHTGKLTRTDIDLVFTKSKEKGKTALTFAQFQGALKQIAKIKYGEDSDENVQKLITVLTSVAGPSTKGATKVAKNKATERLTDTSKYTGSHKERFNEDGKGRGIQGRKDTPDTSGYVTGYGDKGKYDETH